MTRNSIHVLLSVIHAMQFCIFTIFYDFILLESNTLFNMKYMSFILSIFSLSYIIYYILLLHKIVWKLSFIVLSIGIFYFIFISYLNFTTIGGHLITGSFLDALLNMCYLIFAISILWQSLVLFGLLVIIPSVIFYNIDTHTVRKSIGVKKRSFSINHILPIFVVLYVYYAIHEDILKSIGNHVSEEEQNQITKNILLQNFESRVDQLSEDINLTLPKDLPSNLQLIVLMDNGLGANYTPPFGYANNNMPKTLGLNNIYFFSMQDDIETAVEQGVQDNEAYIGNLLNLKQDINLVKLFSTINFRTHFVTRNNYSNKEFLESVYDNLLIYDDVEITYDESLLSYIQKLNPDESNLVFLETEDIMNIRKQYPDNILNSYCDNEDISSCSQIEQDKIYDNRILYIDNIIYNLTQLVSQKNSIVIYISRSNLHLLRNNIGDPNSMILWISSKLKYYVQNKCGIIDIEQENTLLEMSNIPNLILSILGVSLESTDSVLGTKNKLLCKSNYE